jgi:hypothetical protein
MSLNSTVTHLQEAHYVAEDCLTYQSRVVKVAIQITSYTSAIIVGVRTSSIGQIRFFASYLVWPCFSCCRSNESDLSLTFAFTGSWGY